MTWRVNNGSYLFLFLEVPLAQVPLKEVPCGLSLARVRQSQFVGDRHLCVPGISCKGIAGEIQQVHRGKDSYSLGV